MRPPIAGHRHPWPRPCPGVPRRLLRQSATIAKCAAFGQHGSRPSAAHASRTAARPRAGGVGRGAAPRAALARAEYRQIALLSRSRSRGGSRGVWAAASVVLALCITLALLYLDLMQLPGTTRTMNAPERGAGTVILVY